MKVKQMIEDPETLLIEGETTGRPSPLPDSEDAMPQDVERVIARITGTVQGVNYRVTARREARRLGLVGWVRNEPDGSVLIEAEGAAPEVEAFLRWCAEGPPGATVSAVQTAPAAPAGYKEFTIQRSAGASG